MVIMILFNRGSWLHCRLITSPFLYLSFSWLYTFRRRGCIVENNNKKIVNTQYMPVFQLNEKNIYLKNHWSFNFCILNFFGSNGYVKFFVLYMMCDLRLQVNKMGWETIFLSILLMLDIESSNRSIHRSVIVEISAKLFTKLEKSPKVLYNQSTFCITSWQYVLYIIWTMCV